MVYNFVVAINTLMKDSSDEDEGSKDRFVNLKKKFYYCFIKAAAEYTILSTITIR